MENINDATYAPETEEAISDADMAAFDEVWEDAPETDGDDYDLGADEDVPASDENPDTVAPMMQPTAAKAVRGSRNPQRTASLKRSRRRTKRKRDTNSTRSRASTVRNSTALAMY